MNEQVADTVAYYDRNAKEFDAQTNSIDLSNLYDRFLQHIPLKGRILDAGCGAGRDILAFSRRGYQVVGFDASIEMVRLAQDRIGKQNRILHMKFMDVAWQSEFDGIWACASLLHVPSIEFSHVVSLLVHALRSGGTCYMSFKFGEGERDVGGRLFADHTNETLRTALECLPLNDLKIWSSNDLRIGRANEHWTNVLMIR